MLDSPPWSLFWPFLQLAPLADASSHCCEFRPPSQCSHHHCSQPPPPRRHSRLPVRLHCRLLPRRPMEGGPRPCQRAKGWSRSCPQGALGKLGLGQVLKHEPQREAPEAEAQLGQAHRHVEPPPGARTQGNQEPARPQDGGLSRQGGLRWLLRACLGKNRGV